VAKVRGQERFDSLKARARVTGGSITSSVRQRRALRASAGTARIVIEVRFDSTNVTRGLTDHCEHVTGPCTLLDKVGSGVVAKPRS
jgi:hypothetical protein